MHIAKAILQDLAANELADRKKDQGLMRYCQQEDPDCCQQAAKTKKPAIVSPMAAYAFATRPPYSAAVRSL
jgi:hypothetical protein